MSNKNKTFVYTIYGIMEENKDGELVESIKTVTTNGQKIKETHTLTIDNKEYCVYKISKTGETTYNLYIKEINE